MLRGKHSERSGQVATAALRQDKTLEVANPGPIRLKLSGKGLPLPPGGLAHGELVTVRTRNSLYHLTLLDSLGRRILIQGGRHFPCPTEAWLIDGTGVLELIAGGVEAGCGLQFMVGERAFMTSPIVEVEREWPCVTAA